MNLAKDDTAARDALRTFMAVTVAQFTDAELMAAWNSAVDHANIEVRPQFRVSCPDAVLLWARTTASDFAQLARRNSVPNSALGSDFATAGSAASTILASNRALLTNVYAQPQVVVGG